MEKVNDLLRKISPQSQNLPVKEDAESRSFYVEGIKEKIVSSPEEVHALLVQAEKRRRVAYTRYNEVSSRSHTVLTLHIECSMPIEAPNGSTAEDGDDTETRVTKVGRLSIVDLAGNERMEAGTEYIAESTSINKSLFFLGKVIEKLSGRDRDADGMGEASRGEHVPFRDSKLTRLLSVHLGGNSQTGMLVTLTPHEDFVEQSLTTLRFAQKASTIKCVAKPVLISKEQSLIMKQRVIITQLHQQVRELKEAQQRQDQMPQSAGSLASHGPEAEVSIERQQRVEQLQALTVGPGTPSGQVVVSKNREVDAVVTQLHRNNDTLRKQKATVLEEFKGLHKAINDLSRDAVMMASKLKSGSSFEALLRDHLQYSSGQSPDSSGQARAWEPAVQDLHHQLRCLLQVTYDTNICRKSEADASFQAHPAHSPMSRASPRTSPRPSPKSSPREPREERIAAATSQKSLVETSSSTSDLTKADHAQKATFVAAVAEARQQVRETERQLREENMRLRASVKHLSAERERLKADAESARASGSHSEPPCKRSDGTGSGKPGSGASIERLRSPSRQSMSQAMSPKSPEGSTRPPTSQSGARDQKEFDCKSLVSPNSALQDFEPIVERADIRRSSSQLVNRLDKAFGEFDIEPIVEQCSSASPTPPPVSASAPRPPTLVGGGRGSRSQLPPPKAPDNSRGTSDLAPRLTMDYFRQVGVRTSWKPGDTAYWRGQECKVVKVVGEDQPLYVVLRTQSGSEVTTDLCLLSEAPPSHTTAMHAAPDENGRPLRLAPLGDLCLERPPALDKTAAEERTLVDSRLAKENGRPNDSNGPAQNNTDVADKMFGRSSSMPARGLSPVRVPSRHGTAGRMRCQSPVTSLA
jgi:centromeric protein E